MKVISIFAVIALILILIALFVPHPKPDYAATDSTANAIPQTPSPSPFGEAIQSTGEPTEAPAPANITVSQPQANLVLSNPFTLRGQARVFENTISYRLTDATGQVLTEKTITYTGPDAGQFGQFSEDITYPSPQTPTGELEVFSVSPKDGTEINKVIIPVVFHAASTR